MSTVWKLWLGPGPSTDLQLFSEMILKFKDITFLWLALYDEPFVIFAGGLNEATQNAESLCQVESLDGNFPAAFSSAFHYSVCACAERIVYYISISVPVKQKL